MKLERRKNMNNNNSNSKAIPILIAVIAILLLTIGLLAGMFLMNNKNKSSTESSSAVSDVKTTETTASTTEQVTTEQTTSKTTTTKPTTTKETTTEKTTTKPAAPKATASISVEPQSINGNGTCLLMTVSGNYSYYTYEIYADCEGQKNTLRKSGTSYDKSYKYEDGSTVSNFVFYVTPYNADGIAGDRTSMNYNGALSLPPSNASLIIPCEKYGTIYSPSGSKVDGLARSYLIDGGAEMYVRHDLTDGWHIKAVNRYDTNAAEWYELYDADDGDYYGWVSNHFISFY